MHVMKQGKSIDLFKKPLGRQPTAGQLATYLWADMLQRRCCTAVNRTKFCPHPPTERLSLNSIRSACGGSKWNSGNPLVMASIRRNMPSGIASGRNPSCNVQIFRMNGIRNKTHTAISKYRINPA